MLDDVSSGRETVSSDDLATAAGVKSANVRRDLSDLGFRGTRGVGYSVSALQDRIRRELGIIHARRVAIVGAGNLGSALAHYPGLARRGFEVAAVYDVDPDLIGTEIAGVEVRNMKDMAFDCETGCFDMCILTVPAEVAQKVADDLVEAGARSILNFAPVPVHVPAEVAMRQVDLSTELQILSYYA
jgi:redox-sensing transcriptional repressor